MSLFWIARNTFREAMRDRLVAGVVVAGLVLLAVTQLLIPLAMGEGLRLTVDLGLTGISLLGLLVILIAGTSLVAKEIERRTIFNLLSRPIARPVYLIGKWAGLTGTLWTAVAMLGAGLAVLLVARGAADHLPSLAQALWLAGLELSIVTSLAVLFSALSTPALSALYTIGAFLVGQWADDLRLFAAHMAPAPRAVIDAVAHVVPNLPLFNMRTLAAEGALTTGMHLGVATLYALLYVGCTLALASAAFENRDFK